MTSHTKQPDMNPAMAGLDPLHPVKAWQTPGWVLSDLQRMADHLEEGDVIAEIGVGAGTFARSLAARGTTRITVDLPFQPHSARPGVWPLQEDSVDFLISFDAIQYVQDVAHFAQELGRVTRTTKLCCVIARSREDFEADGLARFFPTAVDAAKPLAPEIPVLEKLLTEAGLYCNRRAKLSGHRRIDAEVLSAIAHRDMIGLATLQQDEFDRGVERLRDAVAHGDTSWASQYTILVCRKVHPWRPKTGQSAPQMGTEEPMGGMM